MKKSFINVMRAGLARFSVGGRGLTVFQDDVFITSYPKSGNTWVRFLAAHILWPDGSTDFANIDQRIPSIYAHSDRALTSFRRPRILKSHEYFDPRYPKTIYIVRDFRSVVVSYYYHFLRRGEMGYLQRTYPDYDIPNVLDSLSKTDFTRLVLKGWVDAYGTWQEHVLSWVRVRQNQPDRFYLLRYEDLQVDGLNTLRKMAHFLGCSLSEERLSRVLELSNFTNLQKLEQQTGQNWVGRQKAKEKDMPFIRSGRIDEWEEFFDQESLDAIMENFGPTMAEFGYLA